MKDMERQYYIYAYENKINGKMYIGQTIDLNDRDKTHIKASRKTKVPLIGFDKALKIYGRSNFDFWTIDIVDTEEKADETEIFWIAEMRRLLGRKNVYNVADGGKCGFRGGKHTEETKQKMSESRSGENNPWFGKNHTDETKQLLSLLKKGTIHQVSEETRQKLSLINSGENHPMFGKHPSIETRNKMSILRTGSGNAMFGKTHSDETKSKISEKAKGRKVDDKVKEHLSIKFQGENGPNAKLTEKQVIEIKRIINDGKMPLLHIANKYNVSDMTIRRIKEGITWKNVKV
jgi:NUMOD3 motif/GIY-YIG catalytic domain